MDTFYSIALPLIIILGILSLVSGMLIFLSCRCVPGWKLTSKLMNNEKYKRFFKTHCNIWWVFWTLVVLHAIFAVLYLTPF
jgi:cytochrome b561